MTYLEYRTLLSQPLASHIASLIGEGVFEKFPRLRVFMVGAGAAWIASAMWRIESKFHVHGSELPWLKRMPFEYLTDHIWFSTYPFDPDASAAARTRLLRATKGIDDMLCFGSGYPNWDADAPQSIAALLPDRWADKVFFHNSDRLFRWPKPSTVGRGRVAVAASPTKGQRHMPAARHRR